MRVLVMMALMLVVAVAGRCQPADLMVVQAESMECDGQSWVARDQSSRYAPDSGLKHLYGARGGEGVASTQIELPQTGRYVLWIRHTVGRSTPPGGRGPFLVSLKQDDRVLAEGRFDVEPPEEEPRYIHRYDWSRLQADLSRGPVTIAISKLEPISCSQYTRQIDCLALTTDTEYVPDVHHWQPKIWMRVTLGPTQTTPIYIHCFADHWRAPWYQHFSLSKDGYERLVAPSRGQAVYLTSGESTPWCDVTPAVHEDTGARLELRGAEKYSYDEWLPSLDATFDVATAPREDAIVKSFHREGPGAGLVIVVPGVLSEEGADEVKSDREYCAASVALAEDIPEVRFGRRPQRFPLFLSMGMRPGLFDPQIREDEYRIVARLGFNGSNDRPDEMTRPLGLRFARAHLSAWYMNEGCYLQPEVERIRERIAGEAEKWRGETPTLVKFMDEPTARPLEHAASCEVCGHEFRRWLRDELRLPLADLGVDTWEGVRPVTGDERDALPALYYYSQRFRAKAFADFLRLQTEEITSAFDGSPPATVNFSDGAVYGANMYLQGSDYFHIFGTGALTMAWSEDWSNIASTYQCCGYNVDLLRAATRARGQQIGMYVVTSYGRTPLDVKLKAYSSLGRGAKILHSFSYGPYYTGHEPGWYMNEAMYHPVAELCREVGAAEDLLMDAGRVPSEVAFLYSTTSDIWTVGETHLYGHDRMHSYLALTHAQVPVDFLSEEDVAAGRLKSYRALYIFGPNLHSSAAEPIARWVTSGGTLYMSPGAAVADEYNRPLRPLDDALGLVRGEVEMLQNHTGPGRYLRGLQPQGSVSFAGGEMDVLGMRQAVVMKPSVRVSLACLTDDGRPLHARVNRGEGAVFVAGFMPGLSYIRKAPVARDAAGSPAPDPDDLLEWATRGSWSNLEPEELSYNPWEYPEPEREYLLEPVRHADVKKPVTLSERLVESFYLEGDAGAVVTLANYSLRPIEELTVSVRTDRDPKRMESVRHGRLRYTRQGTAITVRLPLLDTDMLKMYW
ncbi:MAG: hypothetical protein U9R79_18175 [Armatimonadota bacterium]|nr:hypothetical protein [Armatimonadota bacterium]